MDSPYRDNRLWLPIYSPIRNHRLWLLKRRSAVLIQRQFRGYSAHKYAPSLLDSEESKADDSSASLNNSANVGRSPSAAEDANTSATAATETKTKTALSAHAVEYLKNWMMSPEHVGHPYPTEEEKLRIMSEMGVVRKQLTDWFKNYRKRLLKPKVEELRLEAEAEVVASDHQGKNSAINNEDDGGGGGGGRAAMSKKHPLHGSKDASVSSLSTSESIWEKGYHLQESIPVPSTVAVAKPAIKSNPVTRSSPRQRQGKRPTVDSPTISVLSPIEKRRLLVEDSGEVEIAVAERKVCHPEDLLVSNGFKLSVFYTDQPCQVPNCKDPACVFGHKCKCNMTHRAMGDVFKGECFSLFKNGLRTSSCLHESKLDKISLRGELK
jgi:hypothetical protein